MASFEIAAQGGGHELGHHLAEVVDGVADAPEDHVAVRAEADGGVGEREQAAGLVPAGEDFGEEALVLGALGGGQATPLGHDLEEGEADHLALDGRFGFASACCRRVGGGLQRRSGRRVSLP